MTSVLSVPNTHTDEDDWHSLKLTNVAEGLNWLTYGLLELTSDKNTIHSIGKISFPESFATLAFPTISDFPTPAGKISETEHSFEIAKFSIIR